MPNEWNKGRVSSLTDDDDGRGVEVFVTDELKRTGTLVRGFDGVWRIVFETGRKPELVSIPKWRFE